MISPLQEHPHLFCNNEFKIKNEDGNSIVGYDFETGLFLSIPKRQPQGAEFYDYSKPENCTLIARPIEDMTDEEVNKCDSLISYGGTGVHGELDKLMKHIISEPYSMMEREVFLYLLEIGVYPFDQSHFDEGTVIDSREI